MHFSPSGLFLRDLWASSVYNVYGNPVMSRSIPCLPNTTTTGTMEDADKLAKALVCNFLAGEDKKLATTVQKKISAVSMSAGDAMRRLK